MIRLTDTERVDSDEFQEEKEKIFKSVIIWWKNYYKIPSSDERYQRLTYSELLEDYFEYIVINDRPEAEEKDPELEVWEQEVWNQPGEFEKWAVEQKRKMDELKKSIAHGA